MPNYVTNAVKVTTPNKERYNEIKDFLTTKQVDNGVVEIIDFDFNKVIPMPQSLNIEASTRVDDAIKYINLLNTNAEDYTEEEKAFMQRITTRYVDIEEFKSLGEKAIQNEKEYGYRDWYNWRIAKWGTKWNSCDSEGWEDEKQSIFFYTAWNVPYPIYLVLSKRFADTEFSVYYDDEGGAFRGEAVFLNGSIVSDTDLLEND